MNEQVVVDFSRVDTALKLVERERKLALDRENATIAKERAEASARIIKYGAAACAAIILSVGVAIWLARQRHTTTIVHHPPLPQEAKPVPSQTPTPPAATDTTPANKVVTSFSQFNSITAGNIRLTSPYFVELTAGHHYHDSNAARWDHAWCYAMFWKDGLAIKVNLATRNGAALAPRLITQDERQQLGLNDLDISHLRATCPWKQQ